MFTSNQMICTTDGEMQISNISIRFLKHKDIHSDIKYDIPSISEPSHSIIILRLQKVATEDL